MAPRYDLALDIQSADGIQSTSPYWILAFARYAIPVTYDPSQRASISKDPAVAYAEREPLIVVDDCIALNISSGKAGHTMSLVATLIDSGTHYLNEILPGDWVLAYIVYGKEEADRVISALQEKQQINDWKSGFKFVGRVTELRKRVAVAPNGTPVSTYTLSCTAFSEFDSTVMYYPQLQFRDSIPVSMQKFGVEVSAVIRGKESDNRGAVDINKIIPVLMQVLFGQGAWAGMPFRNDSLTPNHAYIVPRTVMDWMGIDSAQGKFSDLIHTLVGIQKYQQNVSATNTTSESPASLFWPDQAEVRDNAFRTPLPLMGPFPTNMVPQTQASVWGFLSNYMNAPLNEAVVSLRSTKDGYIYPFFTLRQTPFTTEVGRAYKPEDFSLDSFKPEEQPVTSTLPPSTVFRRRPTTRFLELPRWVVNSSLVTDANIGRSDQLRQNLVYVFGTGPGVPFNEQMQFILAGPVKDDLDIMRNGIRPYMPSVNCFLRDLVTGPSDWRDIMSDIVMGQHLTLNGTLSLSGVRAPISPGDNVEFEGVVYHIEGLNHSTSIAPNGTKNFTTSLMLSRGMRDTTALLPELLARPGVTPERSDQFANIRATDSEGFTPGITKDS